MHELSIVNGKAEMFSGNNMTPWHGLGNVVAGLLTAQEAIIAAHLDWLVASMPVTVAGKELSKEDFQAIVRQDTLDTLGIVKGRYNIIQNAECFDFMDSLVSDGVLKYETAGALRGGKVVWMLAKYNGEIDIAGDQHKLWLLLVTSHDSSHCLEVCWVTERVVCANTLSIALRGKKNSVKIRHCKSWKDKRNEAVRVLGLTQDYFADMREQLAALNQHPMTQDDMNAFTKLLFPTGDENDVPTRTSNIRSNVSSLFTSGAGNHGATRWDALNAVTDYADHASTIRGDNSTRLESSIFGSAASLKQKAFELLTADDLMEQLLSKKHVVSASSTTLVATDDFSRLMNS